MNIVTSKTPSLEKREGGFDFKKEIKDGRVKTEG